METITLFKLFRLDESGNREYWDGSESPYSTASNSYGSTLNAYTTTSIEGLRKKVSKVRKKFHTKYDKYLNGQNASYRDYAIGKFSIWNNTFIEVSELKVIGQASLDESI